MWLHHYHYLIEKLDMIYMSHDLHQSVLHVQAYKYISWTHLENSNHSGINYSYIGSMEISLQSKFGPTLDLSYLKHYHFPLICLF